MIVPSYPYKMKTRSLFPLLLVLLASCQPAPPATPTTEPTLPAFECDTPGEVRDLHLEATRNGTSYQYGMYLPPCYDIDTGRAYPILYLVPGRSSGPGTWFSVGLASIADDLILSREVAPFIIVTTENIDSDMNAETITGDLIPYIESHYRVDPARRHHAVAGGSLGGIAAYRIGFRAPDKFAAIGMFGSGAIHGEEEQVRAWLAAMTPENRPRVFLNTGFGDALMLERAQVMISLLDEYGIHHTHIFSDGNHSYAYWALNLPAFLHWLALDW
jgi:enterochelin esterase-like enzyme